MGEHAQPREPRIRVDPKILEVALGRLVGHPTDVILNALLARRADSLGPGDPEAALRALESIDPFLAKEVRALTAVLAAAQSPERSEES